MASQTTEKTDTAPASPEIDPGGVLHTQARQDIINAKDAVEITGFDQERIKDRALLSPDEEKKLLRRVDFRLMILCAIIFMIKNVDANNVSISYFCVPPS